MDEAGLFGGILKVVGAGVSPAGGPRLPLRLMISLLYLKHAFNESDEGVVERWAETPAWQYFSGMDYFEHRWPCDPSQHVHLRKAMGEEGAEVLLQQTINVAISLKLIANRAWLPRAWGLFLAPAAGAGLGNPATLGPIILTNYRRVSL
jgi:IS5 family transposase